MLQANRATRASRSNAAVIPARHEKQRDRLAIVVRTSSDVMGATPRRVTWFEVAVPGDPISSARGQTIRERCSPPSDRARNLAYCYRSICPGLAPGRHHVPKVTVTASGQNGTLMCDQSVRVRNGPQATVPVVPTVVPNISLYGDTRTHTLICRGLYLCALVRKRSVSCAGETAS